MFKRADRLPAIAGVATILLLLGLGTYTRGSLADAWRMLRIPALTPSFADTRTITHSIDCLHAGQDPYTVRHFDPWHRLYNYPPIWLDAAQHLGLTSRTSNLMGTTLALLTAATCIFLFRAKNWTSALIIFFAVTSWAVLLAEERGNIDEVVFALLVFGLVLIDRQRPALKSPLQALLIAALTVLKIYPVAASAIFLGRRNGAVKALLAAAFSVAALVLTSGHRLRDIFANTPQDSELSFGAYPFFLAMSRRLPLLSFEHHRYASLGALLIAILSVAIAYIYREQVDRFLPKLDFDHPRGQLAASCLAIFCFAFVAGANYGYRLIFLLGVLTLLAEDLNTSTSRRSLFIAVPILLLMEGQLYLSFSHEIIDGLVFIISCAWLGTSLLQRMIVSNTHPQILHPQVAQSR